MSASRGSGRPKSGVPSGRQVNRWARGAVGIRPGYTGLGMVGDPVLAAVRGAEERVVARSVDLGPIVPPEDRVGMLPPRGRVHRIGGRIDREHPELVIGGIGGAGRIDEEHPAAVAVSQRDGSFADDAAAEARGGQSHPGTGQGPGVGHPRCKGPGPPGWAGRTRRNTARLRASSAPCRRWRKSGRRGRSGAWPGRRKVPSDRRRRIGRHTSDDRAPGRRRRCKRGTIAGRHRRRSGGIPAPEIAVARGVVVRPDDPIGAASRSCRRRERRSRTSLREVVAR